MDSLDHVVVLLKYLKCCLETKPKTHYVGAEMGQEDRTVETEGRWDGAWTINQTGNM